MDEGTAQPIGSTGDPGGADRPVEHGGGPVPADDATEVPADPAHGPVGGVAPPAVTHPAVTTGPAAAVGSPVDAQATPPYGSLPVSGGAWGPPAYAGPPTYAVPVGQPPYGAATGPSQAQAYWAPPPGPGWGAPSGPPGAYPVAWPAGIPPQPPAPPARTHRWGLGAYLVVEAVFLLASVALGLLLGDRLTSSAGALALALVVPTILAAGTAILITTWRGNGPRIDLGLQFSWRDVGVGLAFGLGGLLITIPASLIYVAIAGDETTSAVGEEFGGIRSGPWMAALVFVIVVFVAPLCEEIVYRGLLWGAVERLGARRWWALVITTVVFALAHFEFTRTPLLLVVAIPIALARLYTGRLVAGVVAHSVNNLLPGISLALMLLGVLPGT